MITVKIGDDLYKCYSMCCAYHGTSMAEELRRLIQMDIECFKEVYADDKDFLNFLEVSYD